MFSRVVCSYNGDDSINYGICRYVILWDRIKAHCGNMGVRISPTNVHQTINYCVRLLIHVFEKQPEYTLRLNENDD